MNDFRTLYQHAEIILGQLQSLMAFRLAGSDLKVELGTPRDMGDEDSVAVIFRRGDGTRAPLEIVVYSEGIAVGEMAEGRATKPKYFVGRLRPHEEAGRVSEKVCERLRALAPINDPDAPQFRI